MIHVEKIKFLHKYLAVVIERPLSLEDRLELLGKKTKERISFLRRLKFLFCFAFRPQ